MKDVDSWPTMKSARSEVRVLVSSCDKSQGSVGVKDRRDWQKPRQGRGTLWEGGSVPSSVSHFDNRTREQKVVVMS